MLAPFGGMLAVAAMLAPLAARLESTWERMAAEDVDARTFAASCAATWRFWAMSSSPDVEDGAEAVASETEAKVPADADARGPLESGPRAATAGELPMVLDGNAWAPLWATGAAEDEAGAEMVTSVDEAGGAEGIRARSLESCSA